MTGGGDRALVDGAIAAVREVADALIVPRFRQLATEEVRSKAHPGDVVTIADEESERALGPRLAALLPGSRVIGEEAAFADPALFDVLHGDAPVWVIDPIDGTANFVKGVARFAVIVALVHEGETRMGLIYEPLEGRAIWAQRGQGAWRTPQVLSARSGEEQRLLIPPGDDDPARMVAAVHNRDLKGLRGRFARTIYLGSAAHDYWSLAEGRAQVLAYKKLNPWDHAAGLLIHEEAGGYNRLLSGARYAPAAREQIGLLCAPTEAAWRKVRGMADYPGA